MIITIIISATVFLFWILLYPLIMKFYRIYHLGKMQIEKEKSKEPNSMITSELESSLVGKSSFSLCQPVPTATTPLGKEGISETDGDNFVSESDPTPMDIDYSLDRDTDDEIDEEQESMELKEMFGKDVCYASGIAIDELHKIKQVIELPNASPNEQQEAGRLLYENKETEIVEQLSSGKTASIISGLIDLHILSHQQEANELKDLPESEELKSFDVNKFLNPK